MIQFNHELGWVFVCQASIWFVGIVHPLSPIVTFAKKIKALSTVLANENSLFSRSFCRILTTKKEGAETQSSFGDWMRSQLLLGHSTRKKVAMATYTVVSAMPGRHLKALSSTSLIQFRAVCSNNARIK